MEAVNNSNYRGKEVSFFVDTYFVNLFYQSVLPIQALVGLYK